MFTCVVFLYFQKVFLRMRSNLNDVLRPHMTFYLLPGTPVFFERVEEQLMFLLGPVLTMLRDDILFTRLFRRRRFAHCGWPVFRTQFRLLSLSFLAIFVLLLAAFVDCALAAAPVGVGARLVGVAVFSVFAVVGGG